MFQPPEFWTRLSRNLIENFEFFLYIFFPFLNISIKYSLTHDFLLKLIQLYFVINFIISPYKIYDNFTFVEYRKIKNLKFVHFDQYFMIFLTDQFFFCILLQFIDEF